MRTGMRAVFQWVALIIFLGAGCGAAIAAGKTLGENRMTVHGNGFAFTVAVPKGWVCLCDQKIALEKLEVNALLMKEGETVENASAAIRIRVNPKTDQNIKAILAEEEKRTLARFPEAQMKDFPLKNKDYETVSKVLFVTDQFSEYISYLNPGRLSKYYFVVSMSTQKRTADSSEEKIFRQVAGSLSLLKGKLR